MAIGSTSDPASTMMRTSLDQQTNGHFHGGRRSSLLELTPGEFCDACPDCDDVCDKEGCMACQEKTRKRCPSSPVCSGEPAYTMCQIRRHRTTDSAWLVADGYVYDATTYMNLHPGGINSILRKCGGTCDCTADLNFHSVKGRKLWKKYRVGRVRPCCQHEGKPWWMIWK